MSFRPLFGEGRIKARDDFAEPLQTASWVNSAITFDNRRWECEEAELCWTAPHHLIVVTDTGHTSQTHISSDGKLVYDGRDRPGDITFVPAGVERLGTYRDTKLSYSALWIDPSITLPGCEYAGDLPVLVNRRDDVITALMWALRAETSAGHKPSSAYVEHLAALAMMRVAALLGAQSRKTRHAPLARPALRRVRDYVQAHIGSDISLAELAAIAGLSADSFARRFKATTGLAPYAFVLEERIRRAEDLLAQPDASIGTIAIRVGFSSQSHFTATFRRLRGTTPQSYRSHFIPET